jgi:hypothetical protein
MRKVWFRGAKKQKNRLKEIPLPFVRLEKSVLGELSRTLRPEFVGRFTDKIVFKPLSLDTQIVIAKLTVQEQLQLFPPEGLNVPEQGPANVWGPSYNRAFVRQWDLDYNSFVYV